MSTELFPINGCCTVNHLHKCYLAMGLCVALYIIHKIQNTLLT
jgi:hypothetical protein